jgi:AcrR family transcriptional regulator
VAKKSKKSTQIPTPISDLAIEQLANDMDQKFKQLSLDSKENEISSIPQPRRLQLKRAISSKPYHHGDLYEALLQATLEAVTQKGVQGLSLRAIAQAVGVSPAAPYRHFADKQEMIAAVATRGFEKVALQLEQIPPLAPLQKLKALARVYFLFGLEHPDFFALMFGSAIEDKSLYPNLANAEQDTFLFFVDGIKEAQEANLLKATETEYIALTFWSQIHGFTSLLLNKQLKWDNLGSEKPEDLLEISLDLLLSGLIQS